MFQPPDAFGEGGNEPVLPIGAKAKVAQSADEQEGDDGESPR